MYKAKVKGKARYKGWQQMVQKGKVQGRQRQGVVGRLQYKKVRQGWHVATGWGKHTRRKVCTRHSRHRHRQPGLQGKAGVGAAHGKVVGVR